MWEECMTSKEKYRVKAVTRRQVLEATVAGTALVAAPAFLRHALAADPIKIGIPTVITGGYAILGSQVQRTCRLVKKMTDAKGGVIGRPIEFLFQDTQGDPAMCVRKSQELVERDNCRILTGVIVSSEASAMLPKLEEWNAVFLSHGNGDGRLTAELFVPRFFRANTSAPMGARALALYLKDAPEKKFIAIASDAAWGRSSNAAFEEQIKAVGKDLVDKIYAPVANKDYSTYITKILQSGAQGCYVALQGDEARAPSTGSRSACSSSPRSWRRPTSRCSARIRSAWSARRAIPSPTTFRKTAPSSPPSRPSTRTRFRTGPTARCIRR
jgi:branched-chain amino acid transport system substrate-binding protein